MGEKTELYRFLRKMKMKISFQHPFSTCFLEKKVKKIGISRFSTIGKTKDIQQLFFFMRKGFFCLFSTLYFE